MIEYMVRCEPNKITFEGEIARCKDCIHHQDCEIEFVAQASTKFYFSCGEKQVTGKLNNPDDSLLTEESKACKEQKSKVYRGEAEVTDTDLISRAKVLGYIDRVKNIGLGKHKSLEYIRKYVDCMDLAKGIDADLISRQAAIEALCRECTPVGECGADCPEVEVLRKLPPVEPKPVCEDCIDRYAVLAELDPQSYEYKVVKELPSVEPKRPKGEWVEYIDEMNGGRYGRCTSCNKSTLNAVSYDLDGQRYIMDFCPKCGADMRGDK